MSLYDKYATTVIGAHSVPDWYEALDRLVAVGQLSMSALADAQFRASQAAILEQELAAIDVVNLREDGDRGASFESAELFGSDSGRAVGKGFRGMAGVDHGVSAYAGGVLVLHGGRQKTVTISMRASTETITVSSSRSSSSPLTNQVPFSSNPLDLVHHLARLENSRGNLNASHGMTNRGAARNEDQTREGAPCFPARVHEPEEVFICRDDDTPELRRALQVLFVRRSQQAFVRGRDAIDASPSRASDDPRIHALVKVQSKRHVRSGPRSSVETAGIAEAHLGDECASFLPFVSDQRLVIVKVSQRGVYIRQRDMRMSFHNLVCCHAQMLELVGNLADLDVCAPNYRALTRVVDVGHVLSGWFHAQSTLPASLPGASILFRNRRRWREKQRRLRLAWRSPWTAPETSVGRLSQSTFCTCGAEGTGSHHEANYTHTDASGNWGHLGRPRDGLIEDAPVEPKGLNLKKIPSQAARAILNSAPPHSHRVGGADVAGAVRPDVWLVEPKRWGAMDDRGEERGISSERGREGRRAHVGLDGNVMMDPIARHQCSGRHSAELRRLIRAGVDPLAARRSLRRNGAPPVKKAPSRSQRRLPT